MNLFIRGHQAALLYTHRRGREAAAAAARAAAAAAAAAGDVGQDG